LSSINHSKFTVGGGLIALGIIFGDIGTSPLYVIRAIAGDHIISEQLMLGGLSCVFWTLTLITSLKYISLALSNDNKGEGGIFALYALVRRGKAKWVIFPAIIGCSTLIADGFITPAISISSAIEGIHLLIPDFQTVPVVIVILTLLFLFQRWGTNVVGKTFGPVMLVWFAMMAFFGGLQLLKNPVVLKALNPYYAFDLLYNYPKGFLILGAVFLCTTGAEALYSDLGHVGRKNIRITWIYVKICLLLSYFGQTAWILSLGDRALDDTSPFYSIMPTWFLPIGILVASCATIIASQALITGVFTMVNEGMKMRIWPELRVKYPSLNKGQIYIPNMNILLLAGCITVVLIFQKSSNMEAAYGLAITIDMLMTTLLLSVLLGRKYRSYTLAYTFLVPFLIIEGAFFLSNVNKFAHGGWFSFMIALALFLIMYSIHKARLMRAKSVDFVPIANYIPMLKDLQLDETVAKESDNLVYLAMTNDKSKIDSSIIYSIFRKKPKRASVYWFLHVEILDDPYSKLYEVDEIIPGRCFFIKLSFGFKVEHKVNLMFKTIVDEMIRKGEVDALSHYPSLKKYQQKGDFKFVLIRSMVSVDVNINLIDQFTLNIYRLIKKISLPKHADFGLELADVEWETVPISIGQEPKIEMTRIN
jgi:KUP system potassium uptake protein